MKHRFYAHINLVVLSKEDFSSDPQLKSNLAQFFQIDGLKARELLKNEYFTILAHGEPENLDGLNDQASLGWIHNLYQAYGKRRKILLLACDTGWVLCRKVAMMLKQQVIAPNSEATFDFKTGNIIVTGDNKSKWVKCYPSGNMEYSRGKVLEASFLE
ncbi:hypothetical protein C5Y96_25715 [Blastopirellula marina]|uniref:Uncharacterized protein n=1 Tax=Blastopirellula marina TaxID=124 RepID=A0A2S8EZH4_9BACT|nr:MULTISPECIES: hypothetical protein [Pirellulaceae]PQO25302.1 hypothetical protein C5Y96_25715 [Blastopirellula marina]RCS41735.1 hypothetical protein DTL36_25765 [Bremerella cremea]